MLKDTVDSVYHVLKHQLINLLFNDRLHQLFRRQ